MLVFSCCGVAAGLDFVLLTLRSALPSFWFSVSEYWIVPTWHVWLLAQTLFVLALAGAYLWARSKGWVVLPARSRSRLWRFVFGTGGIAVIVLLIIQLTPLALLINFVLLPVALLILLYTASGRWDSTAATLIVFTNVVVTFLAGIPDLLLHQSLSFITYESLKAVLGSGVLAGLSGLWLARSTR